MLFAAATGVTWKTLPTSRGKSLSRRSSRWIWRVSSSTVPQGSFPLSIAARCQGVARCIYSAWIPP